MSGAYVRPRPGIPEPMADGVLPMYRSSYDDSFMSERASDSSSSKVEAKRESLMAEEKAWLGGEEENDTLLVGTDDGRAPLMLLGLRPERRGQMPPEGFLVGCIGEEVNP